MVRGPRRSSAPTEGTAAPPTRRLARKMEKALANSHTGYAGQSIIEMLEQSLTEACTQFLVIRAADSAVGPGRGDGKRLGEARGRIRGIAMSVAMMRHPLRRYETAWWGYVKKLEKRHMAMARDVDAKGVVDDRANP